MMVLRCVNLTCSAPSRAILGLILALPVALTSVIPRQPAVRMIVERFAWVRRGERAMMMGRGVVSSAGGLWRMCSNFFGLAMVGAECGCFWRYGEVYSF